MKIRQAEIDSALSAYAARPALARTAAPPPAPATLSLAARALRAAGEPFYRTEVVDELRRRIAERRYAVPSEEIVAKLLGRLAVDAA